MSLLLTLALLAATAAAPTPLEPPGNGACLDCHATTQKARTVVATGLYAESPHGLLSCERCHADAAGPGHAADPQQSLGLPGAPGGRERLAEYSARCVKCHAAITPSYEKSFHGIAIRHGDLRAATCVDCHGVHEVFGAKDVRSLIHPERLAGSCGTKDCHPGAPAGFAAGREHVNVAQPVAGTTDVWLYYIWKFFIGLILFDVMKDGPIVMFELLRRIRG